MSAGTELRRRIRRKAWSGAAAVTRAVNRLSADQRMRPDFLVVGTQRGGTTSLYKALRQHPAFLPATMHKGVHYFDMAYRRPMSWYLAHFPTRRRAAAATAALGSRVVTGEFSPYYMWHPLAAQRFATDLPGVKVVAMLRDPVERAYSAHAHEFARGFETGPFAQAVELEPQRLAGEIERMVAEPTYASHAVCHQAYLARGRYIEQIERMAGLVGRDRIHLIDSAEFFARPARVLAELCDFLEIPSATGRISFEQHNARPRSAMPDDVRERLRGYFAPYDARLAEWWGRTLSWRADG